MLKTTGGRRRKTGGSFSSPCCPASRKGFARRSTAKMDEIHDLVQRVTTQCASRGVSVSEVLAAFVTRTVIEKPGLSGEPICRLDHEVTEVGVENLISRSVERLLEIDSPSLETIKMQVAFDSSYVEEEESLAFYYQRRHSRQKELQKAIVALRPKDSTDFDALTTVHRQIFSLLLHHANDGTKVERGVEREVAAALESVFPRISLKAFINLGAEEKGTQLDELANIVLGIRIFNQHIGKGGVNMPNPEQEVGVLLQSVGASLASEVEKSQQSCAELQEMVVHSHTHTNEDVTSEELCRWKDELANRRQYMSYLQSLQEDITVSERNVASLQENLASEISDLRELVGSRASVPKEHVYPKFYEIATQWTALCHEKRLITGRIRTAKILQTYSNSYKSSTRGTSHEFRQGNNVAQEGGEWDRGIAASSRGVTLNSKDKPSLSDDFAERNTGATSQDAVDMLQDRQNHGQLQDPNSPTAGTSSERPVKLSIESTPEFMQLPLEYQGFCPWTIVRRQGLLLPGKPELGVIRYTNRFFVFTHQSAINDFMDDPEHFINGALQRARISPELIHLLRLQDDFPDTSIMRILQGENNSRRRQSLALSKPERRDIGTETPTHFIAKDLQTGYHWNEWYLRRRALKVANLRNCATRSQQTDVSHIRRTNSTQIYLRREKATQTNRNSGSKPPRTVQYFKGKTRRNSLCMTPIGVSLDGTNETRGQPQLLKAQIGRRFELTALRGMCSRISAYSRLVIKCRRLRVTGEPNERHIRRTKYKSTLTEHWLVARCSGEPGASLQMN